MDQSKPIVALDFETVDEVVEFMAKFQGQSLNVKVGMELYYLAGQTVVDQLIQAGHDVFLDLKLHDIPNTVKRAMTQLAKKNVGMVNVHANGGHIMMEAALEGLQAGVEPGEDRPLLIAVTQLTSTSPAILEQDQQVKVALAENVVHLARLAQQSGLDGVVCSAQEVPMIKAACGKDFLTVTPGIRPADSQPDDQVRITTPGQARELGSDYIVVGRPITQAKDSKSAYRSINQEWNQKG
ncbi:orotidine-5'-phosphate decarboxylase [Hutsoniella sourekii]|uniref:orotidine-5'-phosphate decarboxylase n=1 Tax=Hutsoniella sourekii TaxID=87650 RepID=UPI00048274E5|nr:orotidine-5'-phosphate decarboxylase [Hutsoniella sourekii]